MSSPNLALRRKKQINQKFVEHLNRRSESTPLYDVTSFKSIYGELIPVFLYDSLMKGHDDHHMIEEYPFFGEASTLADDFVLMSNDYHNVIFPYQESLSETYRISDLNNKPVMGELYGFPLEGVMWLDRMYNNGEEFFCEQIPIILHTKEESRQLVENVLCYFGDINHWKYANKATEQLLMSNCVQVSPYTHRRMFRMDNHNPVRRQMEWEQAEEDLYDMNAFGYSMGHW